MSIPQFPERGQNIFQDARRRGLAGIIGGTLDNLTMGMTDFDKRGDSLGQAANKKFLKEFIFGTEGKKMKDMDEPLMTGPGMPPLPDDEGTTESIEAEIDPSKIELYKDRMLSGEEMRRRMNEEKYQNFIDGVPVPLNGPNENPIGGSSKTSITEKVEEFLDPTGEKAEKKKDNIKDAEKTTTQKVEEFLDPTEKQAEERAKTINIGGKEYNVYTDKFTGLDFVPNDPRISTNPEDFNRHGQPLTEEQKRLRDSGVMFQSHLPSPIKEEDEKRYRQENMKIAFGRGFGQGQ